MFFYYEKLIKHKKHAYEKNKNTKNIFSKKKEQYSENN